MRLSCFLATSALLLQLEWAHSARIDSCPEECFCEETLCRRKCRGVAVNCYQQNLTTVPDGMPSSATGILLSKNGLKYLDFSSFANLARLTDLFVDNNTVARLLLSKPVYKLIRLGLRNNSLRALPERNLTHLKALGDLFLENNKIQSIRGVIFPPKLRKLHLDHNYITALTGGTFRKLKNLRVLKLNNNKISRIKQAAFRPLKGLEVLELAGNLLTTISRNTFAPLGQAFYLNLKNNQIGELHGHSFRLLGAKREGHHQIRLEHNQLQFIESTTFSVLAERPSSYSLYLDGNPIFCDCNLQNFLNESKVLVADDRRTMCSSPPEYATTTLRNLYIDDCCL